VIDFVKETLSLIPFLFATYLVLEAVEARAGSALGSFLGRARSVGPLAGAIAGAVPQCGVSAAAASLYAGGVVTVGTLLAVFLSTSDELLPVLFSEQAPVMLLVKIAGIKLLGALVAGFAVDSILRTLKLRRREVSVSQLCEHSHCHCAHRRGIVVPALIHTAEIFFFIVVVSGLVEIAMHFFGEDCLSDLCLNRPLIGEMVSAAVGLVPNCAVSVAGAKLYLAGAMSPGAMMAASFSGSGLGLLVLFRTNRSLKENLLILLAVYFMGVVFGFLSGFLF
jgi:hypothetical protein